ncbi:hypothetical protein A4A49_43084 [Nicotiana attenuata]|uniref:Uncharacterized protein n=1 Tax=Nicotiana attenuata TaxID=49451 RepID=A0A314KNI3_NICAT|nr:hypothetical protein A4A49_43084 [Nicotiana attenuata]
MERTPTKKNVDEPLHGSPINHNILCQDVRNKLKNLKIETNLLMLRLTREIGADYVKRLLDSYPLTSCYDMLEELVAEHDEKPDTPVIVISSDTEAASKASKCVNQKTE